MGRGVVWRAWASFLKGAGRASLLRSSGAARVEDAVRVERAESSGRLDRSEEKEGVEPLRSMPRGPGGRERSRECSRGDVGVSDRSERSNRSERESAAEWLRRGEDWR